MTLIVPSNKQVESFTWVAKNEAGDVTSHGLSPAPRPVNSESLHTYESLDECVLENIVVAQAEARSIAHAILDNKWAHHDRARVYASKVDAALEYRRSLTLNVRDILVDEAAVRGITVEAQVQSIEARAYADEALELAEIQRIAEKLAAP